MDGIDAMRRMRRARQERVQVRERAHSSRPYVPRSGHFLLRLGPIADESSEKRRIVGLQYSLSRRSLTHIGEWAERYMITSLKSRISTRSMVRDGLMAYARGMLLPVTSAS